MTNAKITKPQICVFTTNVYNKFFYNCNRLNLNFNKSLVSVIIIIACVKQKQSRIDFQLFSFKKKKIKKLKANFNAALIYYLKITLAVMLQHIFSTKIRLRFVCRLQISLAINKKQ